MLETKSVDNLTHTLAGILVAEAVCQLRARRALPSARFRRLAWAASVIGNNLPDADFAYVAITPGKLGYLLHHRGHTHTVVVGLLLAALTFWVMRLFVRRKGGLSSMDLRWLGALTLFGPLLHMAMDASNVYGVHPFWPLYDGWVYGDSIFIIEPLFWCFAVPAVLFAARSLWLRIPLALLAGATLVLPWVTGLVARPMRFVIATLLVATFAVLWRRGATARVVVGIGGSAVVFATFVAGGALARRQLATAVTQRFGDETVRDLVLSPFPGSPECWTAIAVTTTPRDVMVLRRAVVAALPGVHAANACPSLPDAITAPLSRVEAADSAAVAWRGEFRARREALAALDETSCHAAAFFRFARVPFWISEPGRLIVGDLRFDNQRGLGFAELQVPQPEAACPPHVPPWTPPRSDLLAPAK